MGLLLEILRHANQVKPADTFFDDIPELKVDKEALDLAKELIERKAGPFEPEQFKDEYAEAMWELIHAKIEHRAPEIVTEQAPTAKVINIMDALKKSVRQGKGAHARTGAAAARASAAKTTARGRSPKKKSA